MRNVAVCFSAYDGADASSAAKVRRIRGGNDQACRTGGQVRPLYQDGELEPIRRQALHAEAADRRRL
jgi:hypothetical protein